MRADPATVVTKKFRLKCDRCTRNPVTRAPSLPADDEPDLEILRQARRDRWSKWKQSRRFPQNSRITTRPTCVAAIVVNLLLENRRMRCSDLSWPMTWRRSARAVRACLGHPSLPFKWKTRHLHPGGSVESNPGPIALRRPHWKGNTKRSL